MDDKNTSVLTAAFPAITPTPRTLVILGLCNLAAACATGPDFTAGTASTSTLDFPPVPPRPPVYLTPGDEVEVKFLYWPELDQEQEIRPDGKIALQLVGHVEVAGRTPEEVDAHLVELYTEKIRDPVITTIITSYGSRRVYVGGEVETPGFVDLTDQMTALEAVMAAGGFDRGSAKVSEVVVVRHVEGQRFAKLIDFREPLDDEQGGPLFLAPRDIVYVPRSRIDKVNQWVDQYISRVIPSPVWTYAIYNND